MDERDNLYTILGLDGSHVGAADIKAAYRKLSMRYHPDRNGGNPDAGARFAKINQAYEELGNPETRAQYDAGRVGPDGQERPGMAMGGMGIPEEVLAAMFGGAMGPGGPGPAGMGGVHVFHMGGMGGPFGMAAEGQGPGGGMPPGFHFSGAASSGAPHIQDLTERATVTLEKAFMGCTVPVSLRRAIVQGQQEREERETLYVSVPAGVDDNEIIRMPEKGHVVDGRKGDVKIFIQVKNDTLFKREGLDLVFRSTVSLKDALIGPSFDLTHLDGRTFRVKGTGACVSPGSRRVLRGLGMTRDGKKGNLIIKYDVKFPSKLTEKQIAGIRALL